jgi:hypothetical protein
LTSHLHSKLNRRTDSPRPPGVDPHPSRPKHALSLLTMRRHAPSHEEGASMHSWSSSHDSSTNRAPFTSTSLRGGRDVQSCTDFWPSRSFDGPRAVPRDPAKVKHFAIIERIHLDSLLKRRRATSCHPDGRAPPGGMVTLLKKPRTTSDGSALLDLDRHRRTIGERTKIKRQRTANLVTSMVRVRRQSTIHLVKTQETS